MARTRAGALLLGIALVVAACGGDDTDADGTNEPGSAVEEAPTRGGTLTFGGYSQPSGLDPVVVAGFGTTGGIETGAIYDTIMRYDPATGTYEPQTAESLTPNGDFSEWTLKIKPDIRFSDSTAYDAAAVAFGLNRHRSGQPGAPACEELLACPRNSQTTGVFMALVKDIAVVDSLTLKVSLTEPWASFPYALTTEAGMIPSPTALKQCDPKQPPSACAFNLAPVGAGPFLVESFRPKDSIKLVRNPNYWGGDVHLDGVTFVDRGDGGGSTTYEALRSGETQAAFLAPPDVVARAHEDGVGGQSFKVQDGRLILMNLGATVTCAGGNPAPTCTGKPDGPTTTNPVTKDLRIRQAVAAAIDPEVINQRAYNGMAKPSTQLLQEDFRWYPDVAGPEFDPAKAKQLVAEAKAAGWDGKIRFLANNTPSVTAEALAVEAMLESVGMDVTVDATKDVAGYFAQIAVAKDFDLAAYGTSVSDDDGGLAALVQNLQSTSAGNRVGYKSAAVDEALKKIRAATDDEQKRSGYGAVAEAVAADLPILPTFQLEYFIAWSDDVHGMKPNTRYSVLLDEVWIEQ